jgi:hypothetical protein
MVQMKSDGRLIGGVVLLTLISACGMGVDAGPIQDGHDDFDAGKAETVRAAIRMDAGEFNLRGGESKLLSASYRYSEKVGRPKAHYEVTAGRGALTVESPKSTPSGLRNRVNEWTLRLGSQAPLDLDIQLGAGTSDIDVSSLNLRSVRVQTGAGEMKLNLDGKYPRDVAVEVEGGAGTAEIRLPRDTGVEVEAKLGIGGVNANGLQKRDGKYYNDAYVEGKAVLRLTVHGGVGEINLSVGSGTN